MGDPEAAALAQFLAADPVLEALLLPYHSVTHAGVTALAAALPRNTHLHTLNLKMNKLGPAGAVALGLVLRDNASLTVLEVATNRLGGRPVSTDVDDRAVVEPDARPEQPAAWWFRCLPGGWCALPCVGVAATSSDDEEEVIFDHAGMCALADGLRLNTTLTELDLRGNFIGPEAGARLAECLAANHTLASLDLYTPCVEIHGFSAWL